MPQRTRRKSEQECCLTLWCTHTHYYRVLGLKYEEILMNNVMTSRKILNKSSIVLILTALLVMSLGGLGYFYYQASSLQNLANAGSSVKILSWLESHPGMSHKTLLIHRTSNNYSNHAALQHTLYEPQKYKR